MAQFLLVGWVVLGAVPFAWWFCTRHRPDVWASLPVAAALVDRDGHVRASTGPASEQDLALRGGLPAPGHVVRLKTAEGAPVAATGLRRGALVLALPVDAVVERRDRVLAELGARLAHDINTPLSALYGHLDLIAQEPVSATALSSVRTCQRELQRLQTTASDLLTFTRLRAGGGTHSRLLAGLLAEEAAAAVLDVADEAGIEFGVQVPEGRVFVDAADADLVRALRNLLLNAFTHGGGLAAHVLLEVGATADSVRFAVVDSGPGLSVDDLARLTQPMARGRTSAPGSGLGLAIVAEVLAGHGSVLQTGVRSDGRPELFFVLARVP